MKRFLVVLLTVVGLSSASAQSDLFVGGSLDLELGSITLVSLDAQIGDYSLFDSFGARGTVGLGFSPTTYLKLATDVLFPFEVNNPELTPYVGGGLGIITRDGSAFNLHAIGGVEYQVADQIGLFGELAPSFYISGGNDFLLGLRFGANYRLN